MAAASAEEVQVRGAQGGSLSSKKLRPVRTNGKKHTISPVLAHGIVHIALCTTVHIAESLEYCTIALTLNYSSCMICDFSYYSTYSALYLCGIYYCGGVRCTTVTTHSIANRIHYQ